MTYHRIDNGLEGRANSPIESLPLQWPVLARLPWVDPAARASAAQFSADETISSQEARLNVYQPAQPQHQPVSSEVGRLAVATDDPAPATTQFTDWTSAASPKRQYRIDPAEGRIVAAAIGRISPPPSESAANTWATRIFQWHTTLAPYTGVAATFCIALTAGLLFWGTNDRTPQTAPLAPAASPLAWSGEYRGGADAESPVQGSGEWPGATPTYDVPDMAWPLSPPVKLDAAPLSTAIADVPALEFAGSVAKDSTNEAAPPNATSAEAEVAPAPVTPTLASPVLTYPSTPFALIDPNAVLPVQADEASAPAPVEGALLPGSSR